MSWHRGHSTRKLSNKNPYASALELHEENAGTASEGGDSVTNAAPNDVNDGTSVVSALDLNEKPGVVATRENTSTNDDVTQPKQAKDIDAEKPHLLILEVHDKTGALEVRGEADTPTNSDAAPPNQLFPAKQQSHGSDAENKEPTQAPKSTESKRATQPELATQIWLKTHHPDRQPVKLLPPSEKWKPAPPVKDLSPPVSQTSGPARSNQPELIRDNTLQNVQPPRNLQLTNIYAQRMMKSLLQYDEKQLKQMLVMGVLSPVEVGTAHVPFLLPSSDHAHAHT